MRIGERRTGDATRDDAPTRRRDDASRGAHAKTNKTKANDTPSADAATARASRTNDARARDRDRDDYDVHTVMYGDTLNEIARAHGTSAEAVCEANGIRFDDEGNDEDAPALYRTAAVDSDDE